MKYWQTVELDTDQYIYPNVMAGIKQLGSGQTIMHTLDGMLRGAYKESPHEFPNIKPFGATRVSYFNMEFTKNSPLAPIFYNGIAKLLERGTYDRLSVLWQGAPVTYNGAVEIMVLSPGQVFLIFGVLLIFLCLALGCLFLEMAHYAIKRQVAITKTW